MQQLNKFNKPNLTITHPELAVQWHPTENKDLAPEDVTKGSDKEVYWKCPKGDDHVWKCRISHRTSSKSGCPCCSGRKIVLSNCLATTHPELAKEWHPTKNSKTVFEVGAGTSKVYSWKCPKEDDHEWEEGINNRARKGYGCPCCSGQKVVGSNCLATTHPELVKEWHPTKNSKTPYELSAGSNYQAKWICIKNIKHKNWSATVVNRTANGSGCPTCANQQIDETNCLATTHPELVKEWHPTKNRKLKLTPFNVSAGSNKEVYWKCPKGDDHIWLAMISNRAKHGQGCAVCAKRQVVKSNSLALNYPEIAAEWHPIKNGELKPENVVDTSSEYIWWQCLKDSSHPAWQATVVKRTKYNNGCSACNLGWTVENVKIFIRSLLPIIDLLSPVELYVLYQQNGLLEARGKSTNFINLLKTGKFSKEDLEKFVNNQSSIIDQFISQNIDNTQLEIDQEVIKNSLSIDEIKVDLANEILPSIQTEDVLASLDNKIISNFDGEVIEFFINSALAKIWNHVFLNESQAVGQLINYHSGEYAIQVKKRFLEQYNGAKNLIIPPGYNFHSKPNLMQRYTAYLVSTRKRLGNWSGTGAGKTLSAILSSRVINSRVTVICCPNNVISGWKKAIKDTYPDSCIFEKNLNISFENENIKPIYLILNYEFFQKPRSESYLKKFINKHKIDFVVIDEIHYSKQRTSENLSKRKKVIAALLSEATQINPYLHILGMSATPVINNLFEGKTLIELITGINHNDLYTVPTINNCIALYQKMIVHGIRWMPRYQETLDIKTIEINCNQYLDEIKSLNIKGSIVDIERVLTRAKIPIILENIKPKTIIYTHYIKGILEPLYKEIVTAGWRTSIYSGDDKSGLEHFIHGNADVLIATSCLSTGVDGLQAVCNRIIINTLPWTHAEFEQLKGRIYRQGQKQKIVEIILPLTYSMVNNKRWSWCDSRWKLIQFKKSIADAAVDGVIPEGNIRTPIQAKKDIFNWLNRLENGHLNQIERRKIILYLSEDELKVAYRKFGDFSNMNRIMNSTTSSVMHNKFKNNPEYWEYYHSLYRDARKDWSIIPVEEAIEYFKTRPDFVIGDFGCGEALLSESLQNTVFSFDHIAINDNVISCDMAHVPLDDESLDVAIFSLSLMGANYIDYLREAYRCLKFHGQIWIAESSSRFENLNLLEDILSLGFNILPVKKKGNFTFLTAFK